MFPNLVHPLLVKTSRLAFIRCLVSSAFLVILLLTLDWDTVGVSGIAGLLVSLLTGTWHSFDLFWVCNERIPALAWSWFRISGPNCGFLVFVFTTLLLLLDDSSVLMLGEKWVMCRAGFEQRVIEPATGYCSRRRHIGVGTPGCWLELMKVWNSWKFVICLCLLLLCFDENLLKGGMHLWCMNSTVVTVALGAAGSSRVSLGCQAELGAVHPLGTMSVSLLSALCSPSGFSNGFPKIKLNLFVLKFGLCESFKFLFLQLHWLMNLEILNWFNETGLTRIQTSCLTQRKVK